MTGEVPQDACFVVTRGWCALLNESRNIAVKLGRLKMPAHAFRGLIVPWRKGAEIMYSVLI
jgi:hypothetical protein